MSPKPKREGPKLEGYREETLHFYMNCFSSSNSYVFSGCAVKALQTQKK